MTDAVDPLTGESEEFRRWVEQGAVEPVSAEGYDGDRGCAYEGCRNTADYVVHFSNGTESLVCERCSLDNRLYVKQNDLLEAGRGDRDD
ncbi:hypothetical protein AArcSl_1689 [Halalkaliarchaeum desulfuricum]|uniref:Uncharacterized protein n=1 Tax=Halalkaliarchaeum desulfuricum TaxID=2055893 RepID=A0A343TJP6_9EURY|nr:hypothetical protein [Halalkaliarchaeum desulfuricum]AUX09318.1 hypothetical protein AArcSl_1689 [Halalkaliarchaeum desulfuricum]